MDHNQDEMTLESAKTAAEQEGIDLTKSAVKEEYLRLYQKAKTALLANSEHLNENYEMVQDDQYPLPGMQIASWLMKNQNKAVATEQMRFMDFQAPIEMECLIVPSLIL